MNGTIFFQLLERIMNTIQFNRAKSMKSIEQLRNTIDEQMRQSIHTVTNYLNERVP